MRYRSGPHGNSELRKNTKRNAANNAYKHELLNNLFNHPYTKIEFVERDMMVSRQTASKYLDMITQTGLLQKIKMGKENYYINTKLVDLFINQSGEHKSNDIT